MTPFTADDVRARLLAERESDEPDAVLAVLKAHDGKPLTKRLLAKLPGGDARWLIRQVAGMTVLEDRDYLHSQGKRGIHLLMAYQLTGVTIDAAWVEEHNAGYFAARRERNAKRAACAADAALCQRMADTLNAYARAKAALDAAKQALDGLTEYGEPFSPDQYGWQRLCGADDEGSR
jgi:hypothetical protein